MDIKVYRLSSVLTFGKFTGRTILEVIELDYRYIIWCVDHLDHFYCDCEVISLITEKNPTFVLTEATKECIAKKEVEWDMQNSHDYDAERPSYGKYAGTYAQDNEGLSDDFIDDVLDGCPEAYWNID